MISECALALGIGRTEVNQVGRLNVYWAAMEVRQRVTSDPADVRERLSRISR